MDSKAIVQGHDNHTFMCMTFSAERHLSHYNAYNCVQCACRYNFSRLFESGLAYLAAPCFRSVKNCSMSSLRTASPFATCPLNMPISLSLPSCKLCP